MALKPHQYTVAEDISYFVLSITGPNTSRMEKGGILCVAGGTTPGSGQALDTSLQYVEYVTDPSGYTAVGVLMQDFVNIDQSRLQLNPYKEEAQIGTKATIMRQGEITTNMIVSTSATGTIPAIAYAGPSGLFTQTPSTGRPTVGKFLSRQDADGYARIAINCF